MSGQGYRARMPIIVAFLAFMPAWAQTTITGSISGSVMDPSGAAVIDADIIAVHLETAAERGATTDTAGNFVLASLRPGIYRLTVRHGGFKTLQRELTLPAAEQLAVGVIKLQLGAVEERVTVSAQGASVQTVSSERSAVITSSQVDRLLIRSRSVSSFISLLPGVVELNQLEMPNNNAMNFSVQGNRANMNNMTLDGLGMSVSGGQPNINMTVSMDAISEVKVMLGNYQAEYGRLAGANVQLITKSGARDFHGGASYYKRHEQFNANNFFNNRNGLPAGRYRYHTWTYKIGGPVYIPGKFNRNRDKLFFYWTHEYWPQRMTNAIQTSTVPTMLERAGDFSQSRDVNGALIAVRDPTTHQPFPANMVPASRIDRNGQVLLGLFPQPNFFDPSISRGAYNYVTQWENQNPRSMMTLRMDYNPRSNDFFSVTISKMRCCGATVNAGNAGIGARFAVLTSDQKAPGSAYVMRQQHIFSPSLINEVTVGRGSTEAYFVVSPEELRKVQRSTYGFTAGQISTQGNPQDILPSISFGGIVGAASLSVDGRFPMHNYKTNLDIGDAVTKIVGAHTLKAGIFIQRLTADDGFFANGFNGNFNFARNVNNPLDTNHPYANAILGVFNSYSEATSRPRPQTYSRGVEWYAQDTWKVNRHLTLDLGIRFHYFEPFWQSDNRLAGFVPGLYDPAQSVRLIEPARVNGVRVGRHPATGQTYPAALIGAIAPGVGDPANGMLVTADDPSYPRALMETSGIVSAPRVGFAYDPSGNGKTAIRGGFGIFYSRPLSYANTAATSFPIVQSPVVQYNTISNFRSAEGFISPPTVIAWERHTKLPSVMNMSLSVQRAIGFGTVVDVGYSGTLGRHLSWARSLQDVPLGTRFLPQNADPANPKVPLPDNFLRPIPGYAQISYREGAGSSNYHSLQVTANRRFARGMEFGAAWTWSKAMDFNDSDYQLITTLVPVRVWQYGLANFDRTHVLKVNWLYDLPKKQWSAAPLRGAFDGWQISGILSFISGAPLPITFSQVTPVDIVGTPSLAPRIVVTGNPVLPKSERNFSRNFRTEMFQPPAVGTIGNAAPTLVRGPGINNWDFALFKSFPIHERLRFQLRGELYNAFNHTQFSAFDTTARFDSSGRQVNSRFGEYTAARNPRIIQLSLRVSF